MLSRELRVVQCLRRGTISSEEGAAFGLLVNSPCSEFRVRFVTGCHRCRILMISLFVFIFEGEAEWAALKNVTGLSREV